MDKASRLREIPLLSFLKDRDITSLATGMTEAHYKKGQYIFKEGDPAEWFHVLTSGAVKCVKSSPEGKEAVLKVLVPGDLFCCEAAVFDGTPHPGCALTMGPVSVMKIRKTAYFKLLQHNPEAAMEIIKYLGNRLNEAQETAKTFALERADRRIAITACIATIGPCIAIIVRSIATTARTARPKHWPNSSGLRLTPRSSRCSRGCGSRRSPPTTPRSQPG